MKVNLIPTKKLPLLFAAFCAAMLAFSHNASAVTNLTGGDGHYLGLAAGGLQPPPPGDIVNTLIGMAVNTYVLGIDGFDIYRSGNDFGSLPPAVFALSGTGAKITIGSGVYSYLLATYRSGEIFSAGVWYIGNLNGQVRIPEFGLIGWTLFGPGVPGVPDSGTTVMLLGAALGALGTARRLLKA
jgi:hypothetical protein